MFTSVNSINHTNCIFSIKLRVIIKFSLQNNFHLNSFNQKINPISPIQLVVRHQQNFQTLRLNYQIMNCCSCFNFNNMIILLHFTFIKVLSLSHHCRHRPPECIPILSYCHSNFALSILTTVFLLLLPFVPLTLHNSVSHSIVMCSDSFFIHVRISSCLCSTTLHPQTTRSAIYSDMVPRKAQLIL